MISRDDDYTEFINLSIEEVKEKKHYAFSLEEIKSLENDNIELSKLILIYIFSGLRVNELLNIKRENVFIDKEIDRMKVSYLITGSKTESGKDKVVPIHNKIKPYIIELLENNKKKLVDKQYTQLFNELDKSKCSNHSLHDTRVTFITLCQKYKVDLFARKRIVGHKLNDITFDIDTVITDLFQEINKIKL